uniref:uncharacterized protein LOC101311443 n=1 Tax=Fragaria vesca subsp. vesca TaxID=101020 RepID=UPI0005CA790D|nr:PREDICTED: uncharacterized protein LOC101311443 [Fragaria vesca subsp. vesca]
MASSSPNLEGYLARATAQDGVRERHRLELRQQHGFSAGTSNSFERLPDRQIVDPVRRRMPNKSIRKLVQQFLLLETLSFRPLKELGIAIGQICPITLKIVHLIYLIWKIAGLIVPSRVEILYFFALKYSQRDHCQGTVYLTLRDSGHLKLFDVPDFGSSWRSSVFVAVSSWEKDSSCASQYHTGLEVLRTFRSILIFRSLLIGNFIVAKELLQ